MRLQLLIGIIFAFLCVTACQTKEEPETRESALRKGFVMMDEGKNDEAISYFAELAKKDPHFHVKLAWASAYANRAGLRFEKIYSFTVLVPKTQEFRLQLQGLGFDKQTSELIKNIQSYLARWQKIPKLTLNGKSDLQTALDILNNEKEPGVRVYAAILRVVLLKSVSEEASQNFSALQSQRVCGKQLRGFFNWSVQVLEQLLILTSDLEQGLPKQAEQFKEARQQIRGLYNTAKKLPQPAEDECYSLADL